MADAQLALFFQIIDLKGAEFSIAEAIKLIESAIGADPNLSKIADVSKALRGLEKSHSIGNALILHAEVCKWQPSVNLGIPAALMALMALLGDLEAERFTAWRLLFCYQHDRDVAPADRNKLLLKSLGWLMQSVGGTQLTAMRLGAEDTLDIVDMLGYDLAARIKGLPLDASNFEPIVDREGRDAPVPAGQRYSTDGWHDQWIFVDEHSRLPGIVVGKPGCQVYSTGAETPLLAIGAIVARVKSRTGSSFETLCDAVINAPSDFAGGWQLVEALRFQTTHDLREEIEGVIAAMAFAGDRQALLESASVALRRGYHFVDKSQLCFALGAMAVASGVRQLDDVEPNDNSVDTTIKRAGEYLLMGLMKQVKDEVNKRSSDAFQKFQESEQAAAAERRQDEAIEKEAERLSEQKADDLIDDEVGDVTPSPLTKFGHLLDDADGDSSLTTIQRRAAQIRANSPESIRVVHNIGNADVARDEVKSALRRMAELEKPLKLALMPEDLQGWRKALLDEFPYCVAAVDAIYSDLISRQMSGRKSLNFKPTLLVGSPGCGKSRLARRIGETLKSGFKLFPCGGVSDSMFGGLSRGWHSSHPSVPIDLIRTSGNPNPVLILDEIEKVGVSRHNGSLHDTVLAMLESETSKLWTDPFVQGHCDLSGVNWLFTANSLSGIPTPLLDRLRIIHVDAPTLTHLPALATTILSEIGTSHGHDQWHQPLDGVELTAIGKAWSRQPSLRYLRRLIEGAIRAREQSAAKH